MKRSRRVVLTMMGSAAVGAGVRSELEPGRPVALHPLSHCGECYPCRSGRTTANILEGLLGSVPVPEGTRA